MGILKPQGNTVIGTLAAAPPSPLIAVPLPTHQRLVYQLHIITAIILGTVATIVTALFS